MSYGLQEKDLSEQNWINVFFYFSFIKLQKEDANFEELGIENKAI